MESREEILAIAPTRRIWPNLRVRLRVGGSAALPPVLVFLLAFALNFFWELGHIPYYVGLPESVFGKAAICTLATASDALYITLVYLTGRKCSRQWAWLSSQTVSGLSVAAGVGILTAAAVERLALATGTWGYSALMPVIPYVEVGFWPALQLPMLSVLVFALTEQIVAFGAAYRRANCSSVGSAQQYQGSSM
jgi:hypothetical protein